MGAKYEKLMASMQAELEGDDKPVENNTTVENTSPEPEPEPDPDENLGIMIPSDYEISKDKAFDGSAKEKALILWIGDSVNLSDDVFEAVRKAAEDYQTANIPSGEGEVEDKPEKIEAEDSEEEPTEEIAEAE